MALTLAPRTRRRTTRRSSPAHPALAGLAGPVMVILAEDATLLDATLRHHLDAGFATVVLAHDPAIPRPDLAREPRVRALPWPTTEDGAAQALVNAVIDAAPPGAWLAWGWNAEFLFHPFCEHRTVGELTDFAETERRANVAAMVVDLYAGDLAAHPDGCSIEDAWLDRLGYWGIPRDAAPGHAAQGNAVPGGAPQVDLHGGLRWRFEEHVPWTARRIDRAALVRTAPGLRLGPDNLTNDPERNSLACPWHHSPTCVVASFRAAKALRRNPGSCTAIGTFLWPGSERFRWHGQQLMDLGMMEPGQWF